MPNPRDVLVALAVAAAAVVGALLADPAARPLLPWGVALIGVAAVLLCWRSRYPVPVLAAVMVPTALYYWLGHPDGPAALLVAVAVYTVASRVSWRRAVVAGLAVVVAWTGSEALITAQRDGLSYLDHWSWIVATVASGVAVGALRRSAEVSAERAEERLARRVEQERLRIARDVHDVVSHSLSMIVVQAGVGAHVAARRPEEAVAALERIRDAGTDALRELRGTLALLRSPEDPDPVPGGGIDRLDEVVRAARAAGVEVTVSGAAGELSPEVGRTAFGIVREAVTNTVRHAPGAAAVAVSFARDGGLLRIRVADDGSPGRRRSPVGEPDDGPGACAGDRAPASPGAPRDGTRGRPDGQGLRGIAERTLALGGHLTAGPGTTGWTVTATLPPHATTPTTPDLPVDAHDSARRSRDRTSVAGSGERLRRGGVV
ncbi:histidine kinase [Pseudonocardia nematodicida]|uniref:histidine kinase n=1 Tax=Pseudonocardia nematodicida TaxID=1206997 RepID=A0ABV1KBZ6_9PSEU